MKVKVFWLMVFALSSMIFSAPRYPEWISFTLDVICCFIAMHVYSFVMENENDPPEDIQVMNFGLKVFMYQNEDQYLWEYIDNVVPQVGHRMIFKTERGVETYTVMSVFQSMTRNVEVYVEPIE